MVTTWYIYRNGQRLIPDEAGGNNLLCSGLLGAPGALTFCRNLMLSQSSQSPREGSNSIAVIVDLEKVKSVSIVEWVLSSWPLFVCWSAVRLIYLTHVDWHRTNKKLWIILVISIVKIDKIII